MTTSNIEQARELSTESTVDWQKLKEIARQARAQAYAPYSKFQVGAALLGASGKVYSGCNVENSSFGLTICAERGAVAQAVVGGEKRFVAVVVAAGAKPCPPCGMCRQVLAEFGDERLQIMLAGDDQQITTTLGELLPLAFDKSFL